MDFENFLLALEEEYWKGVKLDHAIKADPYSSIARVKVVQRILKAYRKIKGSALPDNLP